MSTGMVTAEDYKFFDFLAPYRWPNKSKKEIALYRELVEHGDLQIETLFENALAQASNGAYKRLAEMGRDFCDNSDAKKAVSQFRNNDVAKGRWTNSVSIRDIKNKIGLLRIMLYSKEQDKFYFFAVPHSAYKGLTVVEISLDRFSGYKGVPLGIPNGKWTAYQVESFERLATITEREAEQLSKMNTEVNAFSNLYAVNNFSDEKLFDIDTNIVDRVMTILNSKHALPTFS